MFYLHLFSLYKSQGMITVLQYLSQAFNLKFAAAVCCISLFMLAFYTKLKRIPGVLDWKLIGLPKRLWISLPVFFFLINASCEFVRMYGIIPIEQFIFHISLPATGANLGMVKQLLINSLFTAFCILFFFAYILSAKITFKKYTTLMITCNAYSCLCTVRGCL